MATKQHWIRTLVLLGTAAAGAQAATTLDGAEIYSRDTVRFGRWEMRMQVAATPGSVSSFFTYHNDSYLGAPEPWREIDIEILGKNGKGFQSNLITGDAGDKVYSEVFHNTTDDLSMGFHTYELDWTPDSIVWRIDGVRVRSTPGTDPQVRDLRDHAQTYRMNLWASTSTAWVGKLDPAKLPVLQTVNWMSYSAYTPGKGPGGSNFTPKWTDDFTTWDSKRWSKGNWTFDGNMADFSTFNAVVKNGYLVLVLSRKDWDGNFTAPTDPLGSTRTVAVEPRVSVNRQAVQVGNGRLGVDLGEVRSDVAIAGPDGRILAQRTGTGLQEFAGLPRGLLLVRTAQGTRSVVMP